jgi:hypothetical protein
MAHQNRKKHKRLMEHAANNVRLAYYMRDRGSPLDGFGQMQEAIGAVVACGCDREHWPEVVREAIPEH